MEKLAETLGIKSLSKSQVSELAKSLDGAVEQFRSRPLDAGPYRFVQADALTQRVREGGRTVLVHGLIATGVNADGKREILGFEVTSAEDGAGWLAFFRGLVARGLAGVVLVTSDAHRGLIAAIAATLPGASWQRCRTHYLRDLLTKVSKASQPWVATLVRTIFDQPDAAGPWMWHKPCRDGPARNGQNRLSGSTRKPRAVSAGPATIRLCVRRLSSASPRSGRPLTILLPRLTRQAVRPTASRRGQRRADSTRTRSWRALRSSGRSWRSSIPRSPSAFRRTRPSPESRQLADRLPRPKG